MPDPFSDAEFTGRAGKLMRMLASDHAGEAEAARLKLLHWLDQHGTTINDVADRLGRPPPRPAEPAAAPGNAAGSAASLREAAMLRAQVREAETRAAEVVRAAEHQRLRAAQDRRRERLVGGGTCLALAGLSLWLATRPAPAPVTVVRILPAAPAPVAPAVPAPPPAAPAKRPPSTAAAPAMPPQPWERPAYVLVEQAQLRSVPTTGDVVAGLQRGDHVTVLQGPYSGWVLVRSVQGLGWLRADEIME